MPTRRTQIIDALVADLEANSDVAAGNVHKRFKYLDELNDFPSITFLAGGEDRTHYGSGEKFGSMTIQLRNYVFAEDQLDAAEELSNNVELDVIDKFANLHRDLGVESANVVEFRTDEGLFAPYGIGDQTVAIVYNIE
jgi:hypothetical protein|tara:strand:+ start:3229 stop:3642 length:414 start_codon:yes stop_codon:yes gene_type:complete